MLKFIKSKRNYIMFLAVLFVVITLTGPTYSLFLKSDETKNFEYTTGLLDLTLTEDSPIYLSSAFPIKDSEADSLAPYTLTIKNTGTIKYKFDLKMISTEHENMISNKYIKFKVNNDLPRILEDTNSVIATNIIINPGEELKFGIKIWLDDDTPNTELGKTYTAKIAVSGTSVYKTLDKSGANAPKMYNNMLPIYYDEIDKVWKTADPSNILASNRWYDYDNSMWANVVVLKNSEKKIYDLARNNNLVVNSADFNNGNLIISKEGLDIGLSNYSYNKISTILKIKIDDLSDKVFFLSNGQISYYYDTSISKFVFANGDKVTESLPYLLTENTFYEIGYSYDLETVKFYVNGTLLSTNSLKGKISSTNSFKVGANYSDNIISNITVSDIYIYSDILNDNVIKKNYQDNDYILDSLVVGYDEFTPMNLLDYYRTRPFGTPVYDDDIDAYFVWIPRFKYKLFNVTGEDNVDSYDAINKGIDIIFEKDDESTGTVICYNNECYSDSDRTIKVSLNDNNKYYTHPAFKYANQELTGIWVSKYEISRNAADSQAEFLVKANNEVLTGNSLIDFYKTIKDISNQYSIIKNTEWGAVSYLSHSKYGVCKNNTCQAITPNKTYISGNSNLDSTTNNIYGVYDMVGSAKERTMAYYLNNITDKLPNEINIESTLINSSDIDLYYDDAFILGDATKEIKGNNNIWYSPTNNYLVRGGNSKNSSIFYYQSVTNKPDLDISTRIVIK